MKAILIVLFYSNFINTINTEWVKPKTWAQTSLKSSAILVNSDLSGCPSIITTTTTNNDENDVIRLFYKKLVNYIMNPKKMKTDTTNGMLYRTLHLHIETEQMERFQRLSDLHDIDALLSDIIKQSKPGKFELIKEIYLSWKETFQENLNVLLNIKQLWIAICFMIIATVWFASHKYQFNFFLIVAFVGPFLLFNVLDAECNRKKEIENLSNLMNYQTNQPCDVNSYSFWNYWFKNPSVECKKYLTQTTHAKTSCTVIDIWKEFLHTFAIEPIFEMVFGLAKLISEVKSTYGIIVLIILLVLLQKPIGKFIKYGFKFVISPSAWRNPTINTENVASKTVDKLIELVSAQAKLSETLVNHSIIKREALPPASSQPSGIEILESHEKETKSKIAIAATPENNDQLIVIKSNQILQVSKETNTLPMVTTLTNLTFFENISLKSSQEYLNQLTAVVENLENKAITSEQAKTDLLILYKHYMNAFFLLEPPAQRLACS